MVVKARLLAGGQPSKLGSRKELLRLPDNLPLYLHLITVLTEARPGIEVCISSSRPSAAQDLQVEDQVNLTAEDTLVFFQNKLSPVRIVYDTALYGEKGRLVLDLLLS